MEKRENLHISDDHLIAAYKKGEDGAFKLLLGKYKKPVFTFIYRFIGNPATAEDLFQEVFLRVIRGLPKYDSRGKFGSWLFGIANNICIDYLRRHKLERHIYVHASESLEMISDTNLPPDLELEARESRLILRKAIQKLPLEQKQVLLLRVHGGLTFKEIASLLDCSINTVLGRMHYAILNLRKSLNLGELTDAV